MELIIQCVGQGSFLWLARFPRVAGLAEVAKIANKLNDGPDSGTAFLLGTVISISSRGNGFITYLSIF